MSNVEITKVWGSVETTVCFTQKYYCRKECEHLISYEDADNGHIVRCALFGDSLCGYGTRTGQCVATFGVGTIEDIIG